MKASFGRFFSCCFGQPAGRDLRLDEGLLEPFAPQVDQQLWVVLELIHPLSPTRSAPTLDQLIEAVVDLQAMCLRALEQRPPLTPQSRHRARLQSAYARRCLADKNYERALRHFNYARRLGEWAPALDGMIHTAGCIECELRASVAQAKGYTPIQQAIRTSIFDQRPALIRAFSRESSIDSDLACALSQQMERTIRGFFSGPSSPQPGSPAHSAGVPMDIPENTSRD